MTTYTLGQLRDFFDDLILELDDDYVNEFEVSIVRDTLGISLDVQAVRKSTDVCIAKLYAKRPCVVRKSPDKRTNVIGYLDTEDIVNVYETNGVFVKIILGSRYGWCDTYNLVPWTDGVPDPTNPLFLTETLEHPRNPLTGIKYDSQFISLKDCGYRSRHYNLCGEFCVAALAGIQVQELVSLWTKNYAYGIRRLTNDESTSIYDLTYMLKSVELGYNVETFSPSTKPLIPDDFVDKNAIVGVGVNSKGEVVVNGSIRHWVVVLGCVPYSTNGLVKIYNPYYNKEEIVDFRTLYKSMCPNGLGTTLIWIPS